uniref:Cytochrome P450 family 2 subfamily G member 57 n=1 Tax=Sphenodon punctatus TaxID=8508 RepID=A0A8D0HEG3_SPHPU
MELSGVIVCFLAIYLSYLLLISTWRKMYRRGHLPPGPMPLPFLGNFLQIKTAETFKSLKKLQEKYGPVFTVFFGPRPIVVLCGHEAVKEALVGQAEEFSGRATPPTMESTYRGHGVIFSNGERWKQLRRFSLTVLTSVRMGKKSIEERIQEEAQFLLEEFQKTKEQPFNPTFCLSRATSNIICSIIFGDRFDYEDKEFLALMQLTKKSFVEISTPWAQFYDVYASYLKYFPGPHTKVYDVLEDLRAFMAKRVKKNQETFDRNAPRDFIDYFLVQMETEKDNPGSDFNLKNLELTMVNLFFAGTETVGSALRYGILLLMKYPEVQAKMHKEIDRVIGQNRVPNIEDRGQMPYVDAVIHEVQRFSDFLPMGVTRTVTRDTQFRGYMIPKGTEIYPMLSTVLNDPKKFKSPESFNPGNFLDENGRFKKNDAFVPFSSGKRICLGEALARMELFLYFTTILQRFQLKPLVAPETINTTSLPSGFTNIAPFYQLYVIPR